MMIFRVFDSPPSSSRTFIETVYVPCAVYVWLAVQVSEPPPTFSGVPVGSSQLMTQVNVSPVPGSVYVPVTLTDVPFRTRYELGVSEVSVGGTLLTVTAAVYSLTPPSLSRILPPTLRTPLSVVGQLRLVLGENALYPEPSPQSNAY